MTRCLPSLLALAAMISADCYAKCVFAPHIQSDVEVWSCVAATFGASNSNFYDFSRLYERNASFSGTLLSVKVKKSHFVWDDPKDHRTNGFHPWAAGQVHTLFVDRPVDAVCPTSLPSTMTVLTMDDCCDVLPRKGLCLVPAARVVIVSSQQQMR
jgi:hypothetical protein